MDFASVGMVADSVYWLSNLSTRDGQPGTVDAISHALGAGIPTVQATAFGGGVLTGGVIPGIAFLRQSRDWVDGDTTPIVDRLDLTLENIATLTLHPQRAGLSCDAELQVTSDGPVRVRFDGCDRDELH